MPNTHTASTQYHKRAQVKKSNCTPAICGHRREKVWLELAWVASTNSPLNSFGREYSGPENLWHTVDIRKNLQFGPNRYWKSSKQTARIVNLPFISNSISATYETAIFARASIYYIAFLSVSIRLFLRPFLRVYFRTRNVCQCRGISGRLLVICPSFHYLVSVRLQFIHRSQSKVCSACMRWDNALNSIIRTRYGVIFVVTHIRFINR